MTTQPDLTKKVAAALAILRDGGVYARKLETDSYTGRNVTQYRLFGRGGRLQRGYGMKTFYELYNRGLLRLASGTAVSDYFRAREQDEPAPVEEATR
jgi:hypothetical protein